MRPKIYKDPPAIKVAFYCHNLIGLGHTIISLRIASQLLTKGNFKPIILTGCRAIGSISIPHGVSIHPITPLSTEPYNESKYEIIASRIQEIRNFMAFVQPHILVVDTLPFGHDSELKQILKSFISNKENAPLCVLASHYPPAGGFEKYLNSSHDLAIFSVFHSGMIYSDDDWGMAYANIPFPMTKVGVVAGDLLPDTNPLSKTILVVAGGGTRMMSESLIDPVIHATIHYRRQGYKVRFVVGALGDFEKNKTLANDADNFELVASCSVEEAVKDAKVVIARCGYSTAIALIRTSLPIIFIPYGQENADEQFDRARKLSKMKNIWMIDSNTDEINSKLRELLQFAMESKQEPRSSVMSFNGAEVAANYLAQIAGKMSKRN